MPTRLHAVARSLPFRVAVGVFFLAVHFWASVKMGESRFHRAWNDAPDDAPHFVEPRREREPRHWDRLVTSRWDAGHYVGLALRGYTACPERKFGEGELRMYALAQTCDLAFFPGWPLIARVASLGGRVPIDYAMQAVTFAASLALMLMWTSRSFTDRFGVGWTYLALLLLNTFTTGFSLVSLQTEPIFLALTMGAFVALDRRWLTLGALLAGAATTIRVSGVATGLAFALATLYLTLRDPPKTPLEWAKRAVTLALPAWGTVALFAFFKARFDDPFVYFHAHEALFAHKPGLTTDPEPVLRSLDHPLHEGVWLVLCTLLFLLGRRATMSRFDAPARVYWYAYVALAVGIPFYGSFDIAWAGMTRYLIHALPLFFALACLMRRRVVVLAVWIGVCLWHYWQADLCMYTSGPGSAGLHACHADHWIDRI